MSAITDLKGRALGFSTTSLTKKRKDMRTSEQRIESALHSTTRITDIVEGAKIEATQIDKRTKYIK